MGKGSRKHLIMVINEDRFFLSHRSRIAEKAMEKGWDVTLIAKNTGRKNEVEEMGIRYIELPINPLGRNPKEEFNQYKFLSRIIKDNPESIYQFVGLKNMLWGGLASRNKKTGGRVFAISGLGTLFGEESNKLLSFLIQKLLKRGIRNKGNNVLIFQNHEDEELFRHAGISEKAKVEFIKGSGVDLKKFTPKREQKNNKKVKIVFTGRLIKEKGVEDLLEGAEILKERYENKIQFIICGGLSEHPKGLHKSTKNRLNQGDYVVWKGHCTNIPEILTESDIMCFPSYYREGVPKSLIEASACGLPIITTDSIGCKDTVKEGLNGLIIPPRSPKKLADALEILINNPQLREKMGSESRKLAEKEYDVEEVASRHLEIFEYLWRNSQEQ